MATKTDTENWEDIVHRVFANAKKDKEYAARKTQPGMVY
jgi:hypothetical protein